MKKITFIIVSIFWPLLNRAQCALKITDEDGNAIKLATVTVYNSMHKYNSDAAGCITGITLDNSDSIIVNKTGFISWSGKYRTNQIVLQASKNYIELPETEIIFLKKQKMLPYLSRKVDFCKLAISKDSINTKSYFYKLKFPTEGSTYIHQINEVRIKAKKLNENVPVRLYIYPATATGFPDTLAVLKEPIILNPSEMGKRELVFNLKSKNVYINTSHFFLRIEWLWPPGRDINTASLTFPYYGVGPMICSIESNKIGEQNTGLELSGSNAHMGDNRFLLVQITYQ